MNENSQANSNQGDTNHGGSNQGGSTRTNYSSNHYAGGEGNREERRRPVAMEVNVEGSVEKAMKILKRKLIKEGLFKELKARKFFEKPCERRKRKGKEMARNARRDANKNNKNYII